jgi:hypothetical protein
VPATTPDKHGDLDYSASVLSPWRRTTVGLLATIVAALAVGAPAAFAAPNEIAYRCGGDICLLDPDNPSNVTNLTNNGLTSLEETPVWSPDGTYIAFISRLNGTRNIYVMNPTPGPGVDVTVARRVTPYTDGGFLGEPAWSPDGSKIAFVRGTAESNRSISVAAADGTTGTPPLIAEHGEHPSWSPDGGKITYAYQRQIFTKDSDGTGFALPLGSGVEPVWSPDGSRIAFGYPAHALEFLDLHVVPAGGGSPVITASDTQFAYPSWSPDGARVAYRQTNEGAGYVRVVNADGSGDHPLASRSNVNMNDVPSWSPDGARVVFYGNEFGMTSSEDIWISNTDGSGTMQPLTAGDAHEPVWKPVPRSLPITPSGGGPVAPIPKTITPKYFWIKTGIPWKPSQVQIIVGAVFCGDITCGANTKGTTKGVAPILPPHRLSAAATSKKKPKPTVVAEGKTKIPAGKRKPLKLTLTKEGIAILKQRGVVKIDLTITLTAPGRKKRVDHHTVKVVRVTPKKHKRAD